MKSGLKHFWRGWVQGGKNANTFGFASFRMLSSSNCSLKFSLLKNSRSLNIGNEFFIYKVEDTVSMAVTAAAEWSRSQAKSTILNRCSPLTVPLQTDCVVIRSDAAWNGTKMIAGLGWTMEDRQGKSSFSAHEHFVSSPLMARDWRFDQPSWSAENFLYLGFDVKQTPPSLLKP